MNNVYKTILTAGVLVLISAFHISAQTQDELKQQIEEKNQEIEKLEEEIKGFQENIEEAEETAKTLKEAIAKLDKEVKRLNSQITLTQKKISKKELEIKELGLNIDATGKDIKERQVILAQILENLNAIETEGILERFLKYRSISEFFADLERMRALDKAVKENHEKLRILKLDLEDKKKKAEAARRDLKNLQTDLLNQREIQKDAKTEKNQLLSATKNQEALYQKLLKEREKRRAEIYEEIRRIENELRNQIDFGTLPSFRSGVLLSPIDGGVITQEFGKTSFARYTDVYGNGFHNGVDFRARVGTPVRAAESGIIKATGNTDFICPRGSYGKWVLIEHPNKLTTLYAHLSLVRVAPRQEVGRGDIIGYSGNSGYTTGPHLHFTVYDARTVQLRQSRVCGVLPYGGYLNPLNYL